MFYKLDKKELQIVQDWTKMKIVGGIILLLLLASFTTGFYTKTVVVNKYEKELIILDAEQEKNKFSEEKLVEKLKELNVNFPHIVLAQAILETGNFKSKIFLENKNLFGMRQAVTRINIAKGTQNEHAYYNTYEESILDYAFYSCKYLSNINTEEKYFSYLANSYAEAPNYIERLKSIIKEKNLKSKFL